MDPRGVTVPLRHRRGVRTHTTAEESTVDPCEHITSRIDPNGRHDRLHFGYVLLCSIIEDIRFHYRLGMRTPFEVTQ